MSTGIVQIGNGQLGAGLPAEQVEQHEHALARAHAVEQADLAKECAITYATRSPACQRGRSGNLTTPLCSRD